MPVGVLFLNYYFCKTLFTEAEAAGQLARSSTPGARSQQHQDHAIGISGISAIRARHSLGPVSWTETP